MNHSHKIIWGLVFLLLTAACRHDPVVYPERKRLVEAVYAAGKITAADEHVISCLYNGTIADKKVTDGDTVRQGQVLYVIRKETPLVQVRSKNKEGLMEGNLSVNVSSAGTEETIVYVRSDRDGVVYQAGKEKGETVRATEPLVLLGTPGNLQARLMVDQQDVWKVGPTQQVLLRTDLIDDSIYRGVVLKVYPLMNEASQSFRVDVSFDSQPRFPFLHSAAEGNIIIQEKDNALVLPATAVRVGDSVLVKKDGKKQWVKIRAGIRGTDYVEVLEGLDEKTPVYMKKE